MNKISDKVKEFTFQFTDYLQQDFVIYGIGKYAETLVSICDKERLKFFLDIERTNGIFCGYPILSLNDVLHANVKIIVVAANARNTITIFERLKNFCEENDLILLGINFGNLRETFQKKFRGYISGDNFSKEDLFSAIREHDAISFDLFDTLIMRKTLYPYDVFELVEHRAKIHGINLQNFAALRILAEQSAGTDNYTLNEIYDQLKCIANLSDTERDLLMKLEKDVEYDVIITREDIVDCFMYAKKLGKKIYLVSDMYLPSAFLHKVLEKKGISGYEKILVSCEQHCNKVGGMFAIYTKHLREKKILHIGDNKEADGLAAQMAGLDAFVIKSAMTMLKESYMDDVGNYLYTINDRSLVGMFISCCFNSPFALDNLGRPIINKWEHLSTLFVAPLVTCYVLWIANKMQKYSFEKILFVARDGFLIKQLFDWYVSTKEIQNMPESVYFYTSRSAAAGMAISSRQRANEFSQVRGVAALRNLSPSKKLNIDNIVALSQKRKTNFVKYAEKIGLSSNGCYAFSDLISSGTTQYYLESVYFESLHGFYMCRHVCSFKYNLKAMGMFFDTLNTPYPFFGVQYTSFLESVLTSLDETVIEYDEQGNPVFNNKQRTEREKQYVQITQKSLLDYFKDFVATMYVDAETINPVIAKQLFHFLNENCFLLSKELLYDINHDDSFSDNQYIPLQKFVDEMQLL